MGFLNISHQTEVVIFFFFYETFEFGNKRIAQISWLNSAWLVSRLDGLDLEMVLARDLSSVTQWLSSILAHEDRIKIYPTNVFFFFFFRILKFEIYIYIYIYFFFSYWSMPVFFFLETLLIKENKTTIIIIIFFNLI